MDESLQAAGVPLITTLVFGALYMYKIIVGDNEKLTRLMPALAILLGCVFGVIAYFFAEELMPANNILTALFIGGASGLASTGTHQIYKQLSKGTTEKNDAATGSETEEKK